MDEAVQDARTHYPLDHAWHQHICAGWRAGRHAGTELRAIVPGLDREDRPYLLLAERALRFRDFLQARTSVKLQITLTNRSDGRWDVEAGVVTVVPARTLQRQHVFTTYGYGAGFDGCFTGDEGVNWFGDPAFGYLGDRRWEGISLSTVPDAALGPLLVHLANTHYRTESRERLGAAVREFTAGWQRRAALTRTFAELLAQPS